MKKMLLIGLGCWLVAPLASTMETGRIGLNLRVDPAPRIGLTYHLSQRFALRPYLGFTFDSTETDTVYEPNPNVVREGRREEDSSRWTIGMGLLFQVYSSRELSVYTGLNTAYTRDKRDVSLSWRDDAIESDGDILAANVLLGLQCRLLHNLAIFGEAGFGYAQSRYESDNRVDASIDTARWGLTNSGIGLIFYF